MTEYETMIVLHPDLGEAGTKELVARIGSILENEKATVRKVDEWGMRELAYVVSKQHRGYYILVEYDGLASAVLELERQLRLSDQVLRFLTVRQVRAEVPTPRSESTEAVAEDTEESL
jgi:small subunit ribosomal protein S6